MEKTDPNQTVYLYKSNFGLPLNKWDTFTNNLWYHVGEKNQLWAKFIYYPLNFLERQYYGLHKKTTLLFNSRKDSQ